MTYNVLTICMQIVSTICTNGTICTIIMTIICTIMAHISSWNNLYTVLESSGWSTLGMLCRRSGPVTDKWGKLVGQAYHARACHDLVRNFTRKHQSAHGLEHTSDAKLVQYGSFVLTCALVRVQCSWPS